MEKIDSILTFRMHSILNSYLYLRFQHEAQPFLSYTVPWIDKETPRTDISNLV